VFIPGKTTTVKAYHKGPEFRCNDFKRVKEVLGLERAIELESMAGQLVRFEVALKARRLSVDFGGNPLVKYIDREYLQSVHDSEVYRLMREAENGLTVVRTAQDVRARLNDIYEGRPRLVNTLYGLWLELSAFGENAVIEHRSKTGWYRNRKYLIDAGIGWHGSDVVLADPAANSVAFSPVRSSSLRLVEVCAAVELALLPYAA
jgi:hypothetical protein